MKRLPFKASEKFLLVLPVFLLLFAILSGHRQDELDAAMQRLAGSDATDCGSCNSMSDRVSAIECSIKAFRSGRAFYYRDNMVSSPGAVAYVFTDTGAYYRFEYTVNGWFDHQLILKRCFGVKEVASSRGLRQLKCDSFKRVTTR